LWIVRDTLGRRNRKKTAMWFGLPVGIERTSCIQLWLGKIGSLRIKHVYGAFAERSRRNGRIRKLNVKGGRLVAKPGHGMHEQGDILTRSFMFRVMTKLITPLKVLAASD
jgi:hypothetical protein